MVDKSMNHRETSYSVTDPNTRLEKQSAINWVERSGDKKWCVPFADWPMERATWLNLSFTTYNMSTFITSPRKQKKGKTLHFYIAKHQDQSPQQ